MLRNLRLRDTWPLYFGMAIAGSAAVVASASTLADLARVAGWSPWTPWLLPAALDVGGSVGGWCWLRPGAPPRARSFGRAVALTGAAGTLVGNAAGHLIGSGYLTVGPVLVVIVGAIPAAVLIALAHLAALLATDHAVPTRRRSGNTTNRRPVTTPVTRPTSVTPPTVLTPPTADTTLSSSTQRDQDPEPTGRDTRDALLEHIRQGPMTVAELVRHTRRSRTTVVGHLRSLVDDGVILRDPRKRYVVAGEHVDASQRLSVAAGE